LLADWKSRSNGHSETREVQNLMFKQNPSGTRVRETSEPEKGGVDYVDYDQVEVDGDGAGCCSDASGWGVTGSEDVTSPYPPPPGALGFSDASGSQRRKKFWWTEEYAVKWSFLEEIFEKFHMEWTETHEVFASEANHRLSSYWTKETNSFSKSWSSLQLYLNPPFSIIDKVLVKLINDQVESSFIIVPVWKSTTWWDVLQKFKVRALIYHRGTHFF